MRLHFICEDCANHIGQGQHWVITSNAYGKVFNRAVFGAVNRHKRKFPGHRPKLYMIVRGNGRYKRETWYQWFRKTSRSS